MRASTTSLAIAVGTAALWACGSSTPAPSGVPPSKAAPVSETAAPKAEPPPAAPPPSAQELLEDRCNVCHGLDRLDRAISSERWPEIIDRMIQKGAKLDDAEKQVVLDHLQSR